MANRWTFRSRSVPVSKSGRIAGSELGGRESCRARSASLHDKQSALIRLNQGQGRTKERARGMTIGLNALGGGVGAFKYSCHLSS